MSSKSNEKIVKKQTESGLFDERPVLLPENDLVFTNRWGKQLQRPKPTLQLKGETYGRYKSWTLIKAQTGAGKTSVVMAIVSSWLDGKEHLGFKAICWIKF